MESDDFEDFDGDFEKYRAKHPCVDLQYPPDRGKLLDALMALDEARAALRRIGYTGWAAMLDPVVKLIDAESDAYPIDEEEAAANAEIERHFNGEAE